MTVSSRFLLSAVCGVALLLGAAGAARAQDLEVSAPKAKETLATRQLEDVSLSGQGLHSILADLALQYDVPIGFEQAMNKNTDLAMYELEFKKGTLAELFRQLLSEHKEYSWQITDEVVFVFPKDAYRDPIVENLLRVQIGSFSLGKGTVVFEAERKLCETPELKSLVDAYNLSSVGWVFSGFYFPQLGRDYTLNVSDASVQSILNRIIRESPTGKFWSIVRDSSDHTLSISLAAQHEDTPRELRRRRIDPPLLPASLEP